MIETIVIGGTLAGVTPLIWRESNAWQRIKPKLIEEFNVQIESWGGQGFLGEVIKAGVTTITKKRNAEAADERKKISQEDFRAIFKDCGFKTQNGWGEGSKRWPFKVKVKAEDLRAARALARAHYGAWSDKVEVVEVTTEYCYDTHKDVEVVEAIYVSRQGDFWFGFKVNYPLDGIPEGLLKPGCKIKEEVQTRRTITCEV